MLTSDHRAQFNLLSSSLSKSLRPELRSTILDRSLTPAQVAVLTPADLASAERREEIEAAKQAVLQQHVKSKEDQTSAIRLGRDGLERAEDLREKEMKALAAAEEVAREKEKRRESLVSQSAGIEGVDNDEIQTPITPRTGDDETKVHSPSVPAASSIGTIGVVGAQGGAAVGGFVSPAQGLPRGRSDSADVHRSSIGAMHSPVITSPSSKTFALKSAWGGGPDTKRDTAGVDMESFGGDQSALDLSHILAEGGDVRDVLDVAMETAPKEEPPSLQSDMDRFLARSVVWSGKVSLDVWRPGKMCVIADFYRSVDQPSQGVFYTSTLRGSSHLFRVNNAKLVATPPTQPSRIHRSSTHITIASIHFGFTTSPE